MKKNAIIFNTMKLSYMLYRGLFYLLQNVALQVKLFMTSSEDRQPHDSGGGSMIQSQSLSGPLSPESALDGGMSALSDIDDDDDTTEGDELSDTDDELWQTATSLQQTRI